MNKYTFEKVYALDSGRQRLYTVYNVVGGRNENNEQNLQSHLE